MWEMYTGLRPYGNMKQQQLVEEVVMRGLRPKFPADTPSSYINLAQACWNGAPQTRPTFEETLTYLNNMLQNYTEGGRDRNTGSKGDEAAAQAWVFQIPAIQTKFASPSQHPNTLGTKDVCGDHISSTSTATSGRPWSCTQLYKVTSGQPHSCELIRRACQQHDPNCSVSEPRTYEVISAGHTQLPLVGLGAENVRDPKLHNRTLRPRTLIMRGSRGITMLASDPCSEPGPPRSSSFSLLGMAILHGPTPQGGPSPPFLEPPKPNQQIFRSPSHLQSISDTVVTLALIRVLTVKKLDEAPEESVKPYGWAVWAGIGIVLSPFIVGATAYLMSTLGYDEAVAGGRGTADGVALASITGILAPILEETVFRGFLLTSLTKFMPAWGAVIISSTAFGLAHVSPKDFPVLVVLGSLLGFSYVRSRNLLTPILIHGVWNSSVLSLLFYLSSIGVDLEAMMKEAR
eukprot:gene30868-35912_t